MYCDCPGESLSASPPFSSIVAWEANVDIGWKDELRQLLEEHERVVADFPEDGANRRAHEDVAQEVHPKNDPGSGN